MGRKSILVLWIWLALNPMLQWRSEHRYAKLLISLYLDTCCYVDLLSATNQRAHDWFLNRKPGNCITKATSWDLIMIPWWINDIPCNFDYIRSCLSHLRRPIQFAFYIYITSGSLEGKAVKCFVQGRKKYWFYSKTKFPNCNQIWV